MIDYDATLKKFFDEVIKWLEKTRLKAKDKEQLAQIEKTIADVRTVAANPAKYADQRVRYKENMTGGWDFLDGRIDPTVFQIYGRILWKLDDLFGSFDYQREQAQKELLSSLKRVKYKNSSNIFKDFSYPLMSPVHFAVKVDLQKQK